MSLQFDNRISWMDIVALAGVGVSGLFMFFGVTASVEKIKIEQSHIKADLIRVEASVVADISRVEKQAKDSDSKIFVQLERQQADQQKNFDKLDGKLDKLIDRVLSESR